MGAELKNCFVAISAPTYEKDETSPKTLNAIPNVSRGEKFLRSSYLPMSDITETYSVHPPCLYPRFASSSVSVLSLVDLLPAAVLGSLTSTDIVCFIDNEEMNKVNRFALVASEIQENIDRENLRCERNDTPETIGPHLGKT